MAEPEASNTGYGESMHQANDPPSIPTEAGVFVTKPGPDDILLGRGAPFLRYEGNKRFRAIVLTRRAKYKEALKNQMKNIIAREVHDAVTENGGRFLMQVQAGEASKAIRLWKEAPQNISLEKCKQALRDTHLRSRLKNKMTNVSGVRSSTASQQATRHTQDTSLLYGLANVAAVHEAFHKSSGPDQDSSLFDSSSSGSTYCTGTPSPSPYPSPLTQEPKNNRLIALIFFNFQQSLASNKPVPPQGLPSFTVPVQHPVAHLPVLPPFLIEALKPAQQQHMCANQMQLMFKFLLLNGLQVEQNQNFQNVFSLLKSVVDKGTTPTIPPPNNSTNADIVKLLALVQNQPK